MISLPGNNTLVLCPKALMDIIEKHLNDNTHHGYRDEEKRPIRITSIKYDANGYHVSLTNELAQVQP